MPVLEIYDSTAKHKVYTDALLKALRVVLLWKHYTQSSDPQGFFPRDYILISRTALLIKEKILAMFFL